MPKKRKLRDVWVLPCKSGWREIRESKKRALALCTYAQEWHAGLHHCAACPTRGPVRYGPKED